MIGSLKLRLQLALWVHRSWPFRLIANACMHRAPPQHAFGNFKPSNTGENPMPSPTQIQFAHASIVDSERADNSLGTRVDAAIRAVAVLDQSSLGDPILQRYQKQKYHHPLDMLELQGYHSYAVTLAKKLLLAAQPTSATVNEVWPESAAELLNALRIRPPTQVRLFGEPCSPEETAAVLSADDPLQAARDLMMNKLNGMGGVLE
jgi:hypothetical protein